MEEINNCPLYIYPLGQIFEDIQNYHAPENQKRKYSGFLNIQSIRRKNYEKFDV